MDYAKSAKEVLELVGGPANVASAAHCATRLRLVIADNSKVNKEAIEDVEGVKGVFEAQGQLQIIFGTGTVNKVYDEFVTAGGITGVSKAEAKEAAAAKQNPIMRGIKLLGDVFVPIIPAIVASGLLLGIMSTVNFMAANGFIQLDTTNEFYVVANLVSSTAFTFLQVLIGFSAAKAFGANPFLGAVMGALMIHPSLESAYNLAELSAQGAVPQQSMLFGLISVDWMGYQGHVIPIVIACAILAFLEKRLHKVVPEAIDLFVTPLVSVFVSAYLTLGFVGPLFVVLENAVLGAVQWLITLPFGLGALVAGGFYAPTVVTGLHQMYTAIDLGQLASYGVTYWLPIASAANIGQAAACLAVSVKTKNPKVRGLAFPAALSGFMGITEPAIFGVNLRYFKVFVAGCIGGAVGALICSLTGLAAAGTGVTASLASCSASTCLCSTSLCSLSPLPWPLASPSCSMPMSPRLPKPPLLPRRAPLSQLPPLSWMSLLRCLPQKPWWPLWRAHPSLPKRFPTPPLPPKSWDPRWLSSLARSIARQWWLPAAVWSPQSLIRDMPWASPATLVPRSSST